MADLAPKLNRPAALRGAAALMDMLYCIGDGKDDHIAKILVDAELDLDELIRFALLKLTVDGRSGSPDHQ